MTRFVRLEKANVGARGFYCRVNPDAVCFLDGGGEKTTIYFGGDQDVEVWGTVDFIEELLTQGS